MFRDFKAFLMRGNVVELATAVILGAAFSGIVDGLIKGIIDPLLALAAPTGDLGQAIVVGPFKIGLVISALINFLLKAGVVYFVIVRPFSALAARMAPAPAVPPQEVLLKEIRDLLSQKK
jgi:large conductance mechanosensitive channel